ncbi:ROK family protein [Pricia sp.]|uniref:ROK family protein n=1 Tax=Pricia sp. TaxID=2268138 RepID=UPI00359394FF
MENEIVVGIDIGGSHITSAAVDLHKLKILPNTSCSVKVDNKASKSVIFESWSRTINGTIAKAEIKGKVKLGFAVPGPFHYKTGTAMFGGNDKYEKLYGVSIPKELEKYLKSQEVEFRFLNDAMAFGVGVSTVGKAENYRKIIAITLGTGFGSAFIDEGIPQQSSKDVPKNGWLWDKPFKQGISDDYFSTRWCIKKYQELSSRQVEGVKEIAQANDHHSQALFEEFGTNMAEFMLPFLKQYRPELMVLGGNISKASDLFLPALSIKIQNSGLKIEFEISQLMEDAAIIGSAKLFDADFWNRIKVTLNFDNNQMLE